MHHEGMRHERPGPRWAVLALLLAWAGWTAAVANEPTERLPESGWTSAALDDAVLVLGHGPASDVEALAETVAERFAIFDVVVGLEEAMPPLEILWIADPALAQTFGGTEGLVRVFEADPKSAEAAGGPVWIVAGDAETTGRLLTLQLDRWQIQRRVFGLPSFLQVALLELLGRVELARSEAVVSMAAEHVEALQTGKDWESLEDANWEDWNRLAPSVQASLAAQADAFLVDLFVVSDDGSDRLRRSLELVELGASFSSAYADATGETLDRVAKSLRRAARKDELVTAGSRPVEVAAPRPEAPGRDLVLATLGRVGILRGDDETACPLFAEAEALAGPALDRASAGLGFCARRAGDYGAADEAFGRAVAANPSNARWRLEQARTILLDDAGEPDAPSTRRAARLLRESLEIDPEPADSWTQLAIAYQRLGQLGAAPDDEAVDWIEAAYVAPDQRRGHVAVALYALYLSAGRDAEAESLKIAHPELVGLPVFSDYGRLDRRKLEVGETPVDVETAIQWVKEQRYEEALAAFEALQARSRADTWDATIAEQITTLRGVVAHNRFVEAYNEAVRLFNEREYRRAAELLQPVLPDVQDAERKEKGEKLLAQSLEWAEKTGQ